LTSSCACASPDPARFCPYRRGTEQNCAREAVEMAGCRGFALAISAFVLMMLTGVAEAKQVAVIPARAAMHAGGRPFVLERETGIVARTRAARRVAEQLAGVLRPSTGYPLRVVSHGHGITLRIKRGVGGREGYELRSGRGGVELRAA